MMRNQKAIEYVALRSPFTGVAELDAVDFVLDGDGEKV